MSVVENSTYRGIPKLLFSPWCVSPFTLLPCVCVHETAGRARHPLGTTIILSSRTTSTRVGVMRNRQSSRTYGENFLIVALRRAIVGQIVPTHNTHANRASSTKVTTSGVLNTHRSEGGVPEAPTSGATQHAYNTPIPVVLHGISSSVYGWHDRTLLVLLSI